MPLVYKDGSQVEDFEALRPPPEAEPVPALDTVGSAIRQENIVVSALTNKTWGLEPSDLEEGYNAWDDIAGTKYEEYWESFAPSNNRRYSDAVKEQIDMEEQDRRNVQSGGALGIVASIGAGVIDLPTLIPGTTLIRGAKGGYSVGKSALSIGAAGAIDASISEAALHGTQELRTGTESAMAIGFGTIIAGGLGAGVAKAIGAAEVRRLTKALADESEEFATTPDVDDFAEAYDNIAEGAPVGAAATPKTLDPEGIDFANKTQEVIGKAAILNPMIGLMKSASDAAKAVAAQLPEMGFAMKMTSSGTSQPQAAETLVKEWTQGRVGLGVKSLNTEYKAAKQAGETFSRKEFSERVARALRRNDTDEHGSDHVSRAAASWRKNLIEPLKNEAIAAKLLPEDVQVTTADSYFTRMYKRAKIITQEPEFKAIVRGWAGEQLNIVESAERRVLEGEEFRVQKVEEIKELGTERLEEIVQDPDLFMAEVEASRRQLREAGKVSKKPTLNMLKARGGVRIGSVLDRNLRSMGVTPKTAPGLFKKETGLGDVDNIVLSEERHLADHFDPVGDTDFADPDDIYEAISLEMGGSPLRTFSEFEALEAAEILDDQISRILRDIGLDDAATIGDIRKALEKKPRVKAETADLDERIALLKKDLEDYSAATGFRGMRRAAPTFVNEADRASYIEDIVDDIYGKVTGRENPGGTAFVKVADARGPLKERTFNIPDKDIEDFLENDVEMVMRRYARIMGADVELAKKFGKPDMVEQIDKVKLDYDKLRQKVSKDKRLKDETRAKRLKALRDAEKTDIRNIEGLRDRLRGTHYLDQNMSGLGKAVQVANTFNYIRLLGGVVASSLSDTGKHVMVHGLSRVMMNGLVPLITNIKGMKMAVAEAKIAGSAAEILNNTRMATWAELADPYGFDHPFMRMMSNLGNGFSKLNGMVYWNDFQKSFTSVLTQNRILDNAERAFRNGFDSLKPAEQQYMALLGVGRGDAERLGKLFAEHGETVKSVKVANTENWGAGTDQEASDLVRMYRAAVNKEVDTTIVTRGIGDTPLFVDSPTGRMVFQFKSFMMASHQRTLMRATTDEMGGVMAGLVTTVGIGMLTYALKTMERGRDLSDNPGKWFAEGIDRSGVLGPLMEMNNMAEKLGAPGIYSTSQGLFPTKDQSAPASRYAQRNMMGSMMGPSFGLGQDLATTVGATFREGDYSDAEKRTMRRLIPGRTLPVIKSILAQ